MSVIDDVKQKLDIIDIIGQHITLTKSGRTFRGLCPFHGEKHPSFYVYPEQQSWHCFGCNTGGDVFSFIMKKQGIDFGEALRELAQKAGVVIPSKFEPGAESEERQKLYQLNQAAALYFQSMLQSKAGEKAQSYLTRRGFLAKTISDFQLGYSLNSWEELKKYLMDKGYTEAEMLTAGLIIEGEAGKKSHDRFRDKLMFPIADARGHIIGFGGRALDDSLPKYTNSPQTPLFDKSGSLYALNLAKEAIREQGLSVIVEGYMDVITAHQNSFNNVVASMGTAVTEKQVNTLKRLSKEMVFALDADAAGKEAMLRVEQTSTEALSEDILPVVFRNKIVAFSNIPDIEVKVIILPSGKDPDDVIKEDAQAWQKLVKEAVPIIDYTFDMATAGLDLTTAKDKSLAVEKLLPVIAEIKDPIRQAHYLQKLARLVQVSERYMEAALSRLKIRPKRAPAPKPETAYLQPLLSNPIEDYCLALLLQHPELNVKDEELLPEYFESSQNREIFIARRQSAKIEELRERLDPATHENLDALLGKSLSPNRIEQKYTECALRLRERYLRGLAAKIEVVLAQEAESGGRAADLAKLKEQGIEVNSQLGEVFARKRQRQLEQRG
ncbi:MAG: DNA primase [Dehalococcoidales bacterium]|nr:DNA primase [Dehalococcoidales bacterium]